MTVARQVWRRWRKILRHTSAAWPCGDVPRCYFESAGGYFESAGGYFESAGGYFESVASFVRMRSRRPSNPDLAMSLLNMAR